MIRRGLALSFLSIYSTVSKQKHLDKGSQGDTRISWISDNSGCLDLSFHRMVRVEKGL